MKTSQGIVGIRGDGEGRRNEPGGMEGGGREGGSWEANKGRGHLSVLSKEGAVTGLSLVSLRDGKLRERRHPRVFLELIVIA